MARKGTRMGEKPETTLPWRYIIVAAVEVVAAFHGEDA